MAWIAGLSLSRLGVREKASCGSRKRVQARSAVEVPGAGPHLGMKEVSIPKAIGDPS